MSEIPKGAIEKAATLANGEDAFGWCVNAIADTGIGRAFSRYIADVSETVSEALAPGGLQGASYKRLQALILPNPEDDLRQEAREICARDAEAVEAPSGHAVMYRDGHWDDTPAMRCTLAALKGRK